MPTPLKTYSRHRVLVLGGTGFIGGAVAQDLLNRGHQVTCLARSDHSEELLRKSKFNVIRGDIRYPEQWLGKALDYDAVIQVAATWSDDMEEVDERLVLLLIDVLSSAKVEKTLIYTGGCWLYGHTGNSIATEESAFNALSAFSWMTNVSKRVCENKKIRGMVIHPAMVYDRDGGVLEPMLCDIENLGKIRIIGSEKTRWTMVHRLDMASLYSLALEQGIKGEAYNGSGIDSIEIGHVAEILAMRFNVNNIPVIMSVEEAVVEFGSWAKGYAIDQGMSSNKAKIQLGWDPKHIDIIADLG